MSSLNKKSIKTTKIESSSEEKAPSKSKSKISIKKKIESSSEEKAPSKSKSKISIKKKIESSSEEKAPTKKKEEKSKKKRSTFPIKLSIKQKEGYYNLEDFKPGIFKNTLTNLLQNKKNITTSVPIPEYIVSSAVDKYISSFINYIGIASGDIKSKVYKKYTEDDFYYLAVVAYSYRDVYPLLRINKHLKEEVSDKYYWLYLAKEEDLFYSTVEIEMYRRRTAVTLHLIELDHYPFFFEGRDQKNILSLFKGEGNKVISSTRRIFDANTYFLPRYVEIMDNWGSTLINIFPGLIEDNLKHYQSELPHLCDTITSLGGIIAGGFVNSCINPTFFLVEITQNLINYKVGLKEDKPVFFNNEREFGIEGFEIGKTISAERDLSSETSELVVIPGFYECVRIFFAQKDTQEPIVDREDYLPIAEYDKKKYKNYNLEAELRKLQKHLIVQDGKLYQIVYYPSADIDVFVTGDDYLNKSSRILEVLLNKILPYKNNKIYYGEFATTFDFGHIMPKIQIIKRAYNNIEEILAGFDIDPARVAMVWRNGRRHIIAPQAYINAVEYGINLIVPSRQSETFNLRLAKYYNKGYEPYLPGGIESKIKKGKSVPHTYQELLSFRNEKHEWVPYNRSDYNTITVTELTERFLPEVERNDFLFDRRRRIRAGRLNPQKIDLIYLCNRLSEELVVKARSFMQMEGVQMGILRALAQYISSFFWKVEAPGSQLTASFNPTTVDYLLSQKDDEEKDFRLTIEQREYKRKKLIKQIQNKEKEIKKLDKVKETKVLEELLAEHLPGVINPLITGYSEGLIKSIYTNVLKINRAMFEKSNDFELGDKLLKEFNGGAMVDIYYDFTDDEEEEDTDNDEGDEDDNDKRKVKRKLSSTSSEPKRSTKAVLPKNILSSNSSEVKESSSDESDSYTSQQFDFFRQVGVKREEDKNKLKEALEIWDGAGQQPYLALQEDGYYDFFMEVLNKQKLVLSTPVYRGTVRHSELEVGNTFVYDYPSSWSTSKEKALEFGTLDDPKSVLLIFFSYSPVRGIHNPFNSNGEDEVILAPMTLKITKISKTGTRLTFRVVAVKGSEEDEKPEKKAEVSSPKPVKSKTKEEKEILKKALKIWETAEANPHLALQKNKSYYTSFINILNKQRLVFTHFLYRGVTKNNKLKVGSSFMYDYPTSWSSSREDVTSDTKPVLLILSSKSSLHGIRHITKYLDQFILAPMAVKVTEVSKDKLTFHVITILLQKRDSSSSSE
jgi:hypothetical protein